MMRLPRSCPCVFQQGRVGILISCVPRLRCQNANPVAGASLLCWLESQYPRPVAQNATRTGQPLLGQGPRAEQMERVGQQPNRSVIGVGLTKSRPP